MNHENIDMDVTTAINNANALLTAINSIKTELCRLNLNLCERAYLDNCVSPILTVLFYLSLTTYELSISVSILSSSPIIPPKKLKLKNIIHAIYDINEECEDLYKVLKKRLKPIIDANANCSKFLFS